MSRCFPFPPPGYEKKITTTHSDILKKEKHREKKHKKEKKDKEKKEDKEKKDKDKDKKEKRRDKKKEKGRDRGQQSENPITSAETSHKFQPQGHNGQTIQKNSTRCILPDEPTVSGSSLGYDEGYHGHHTSFSEEPNGTKFLLSTDRTIMDDAERDANPKIREKIIPISLKRNDGGGTFNHNSHLANNFEYSNLALELDRRLKNEAEQPFDLSQYANKLNGANQKRDGMTVESVSSHIMEKADKRNTGSNGRYVRDKSLEVTSDPYTAGLGQGNHERMPTPSLESGIEKKSEGQERIIHQEDELQQRGKKRKDKDRNGDKKSHKSREKARKEDNTYSRSDLKSLDQSTLESHNMNTLCVPNKEMLHTREYNISRTSNDEKLSQTKGPLTNGISHVTGPSILSRPLHNRNGKAPELNQMLVKSSHGEQVAATSNIKMDNVGKINGLIETHLQRPTIEQIVRARPRSPHPDAKQFLAALAIPNLEELSEIDDSDWLFSRKEGAEKKVKVDDSLNSTTAEMPQVWSKATTIESADVCALPYVIPF